MRIKLIEGLVAQGLRTSKAGALAYPLPKAHSGAFAAHAPADPAAVRAAE